MLLCMGHAAQAQSVPPGPEQAVIPKQERSAAERKMEASLIAASRAAGRSRQVVEPVFVVIRARVSPALEAFVASLGGRKLSAFARFDTLTAEVPPGALAAIAARADVYQVGPREIAVTNRYIPTPEEDAARRERLRAAMALKMGTVDWEGVKAHGADAAHAADQTGVGVKVCVLSDGVDGLAGRQASLDLPAVDVLPGQDRPVNWFATAAEGTAMLEIIHDMAPGATLGFATGSSGSAQMATNIINLRQAGCDVIVDDITYFNEGAFQDGPISQAVNQVTADGALFFSSAANSGHLTRGQSGTFEGDFQASTEAIPAVIQSQSAYNQAVVELHAFANGKNYTTLTRATSNITLKWSDPLLGSGNDYDLIVTNAAGTAMLGYGADPQSGAQDPYERATRTQFPIGARIYVVKYSGAARALRLDTHRGRLNPADATAGSTVGHNAAGSGISVAAVDVETAVPAGGVFTGGAANPVTSYSSDGPRRMFYRPDGTPISPGNLLFATGGGEQLHKVDMAAADCGTTTTPGFTTFCGTSAAAPTAAAMAALIKGANPGARNAKVLAAMRAAALDIEAPGDDRDSGMGIAMVPAQLTLAYTISGNVTGLTGGAQVELRNNNDGPSAQTQGNGAFSFATTHGSGYAISAASPTGHTCAVASGSGTATDDVTGVAVACQPDTYALAGAAQPAIGGSVACPANAVFGQPASCTATANAGWRFKAFDPASACTRESGADGATCEIDNLQAAHTVTAQFEPWFAGTTVPASGAGGPGTATFTGGGDTCRFDTSTAFVAAPGTLPAGQTLPQGMFRFKLVGCERGSEVRMRVTWPGAVAGYLKHGKASNGATQDSYYPLVAEHDLDISGNTVSFTLKDGALGDDDWAENGEIADPSGPVAAAPDNGGGSTRSAHPVPTLGAWGALLLPALVGLLGLRRFKAKSAASA